MNAGSRPLNVTEVYIVFSLQRSFKAHRMMNNLKRNFSRGDDVNLQFEFHAMY